MKQSTSQNKVLITEKEWSEVNIHFNPQKEMDTTYLMTETQWDEYNMMNQNWEYPLDQYYSIQKNKEDELKEPEPIYIVRTIEEYSESMRNIYNTILQLDHAKTLLLEEKKKAEKEFFSNIDAERIQYYQQELNKAGHKHFTPLFEVESLSERLFKIRLNSLLPIYLKTKQTPSIIYEKYQYIYQGTMTDRILNCAEEIPKFKSGEKIYVKIIQYHKNQKISDLDNRFHTFIFNSLRQAGILEDDSFKHLCYMDEGRYKKGDEYTEIFVGYYSDMSEIDTY